MYPGIDGFLSTRASFMLDVVCLAMLPILIAMAWSIWLVRYRRRYLLHKRIQLTLGALLLATVAAFEADMRVNGWQMRAEPSPYFDTWVFYSLYIHLTFAISSAGLWIVVIVRALRRFPNPPAPGAHSPWHVFWARLAALDMLATALTGWTFYWLAFVA
ncbi:MAG: DUF420 domain-containing protein [Pirellulales bacterium]